MTNRDCLFVSFCQTFHRSAHAQKLELQTKCLSHRWCHLLLLNKVVSFVGLRNIQWCVQTDVWDTSEIIVDKSFVVMECDAGCFDCMCWIALCSNVQLQVAAAPSHL